MPFGSDISVPAIGCGWPPGCHSNSLPVIPAGAPGDSFLHDASDMLHRRFRIAHATIQVETAEEDECRLASPAVV